MLSLDRIADLLDAAERKDADKPGGRYILISDTLARQISATLRQTAKGESPRAVPLRLR